MMKNRKPLLTNDEIAAYAAQIAALDDDALVTETAAQIDEAGKYVDMSPADQKTGACYIEFTTTRQKPHLYQRAWNRAARDNDAEVTEADLRRAQAPEAAAA